MAMKKYTEFDAAKYLRTDEERAWYLEDAFETGDKASIVDAIGVVARSKGMSELARETKLTREGLYKALSADGNPQLDTILRVLGALKLRISVIPAQSTKRSRQKRRKAA
jgi:probable addiction module antidote protein